MSLQSNDIILVNWIDTGQIIQQQTLCFIISDMKLFLTKQTKCWKSNFIDDLSLPSPPWYIKHKIENVNVNVYCVYMAMEWSDTDHDVTNYGEEGDDSSNYGNEGSSHVFPAMVLQLQLLVICVLQTQL